MHIHARTYILSARMFRHNHSMLYTFHSHEEYCHDRISKRTLRGVRPLESTSGRYVIIVLAHIHLEIFIFLVLSISYVNRSLVTLSWRCFCPKQADHTSYFILETLALLLLEVVFNLNFITLEEMTPYIRYRFPPFKVLFLSWDIMQLKDIFYALLTLKHAW